MSIASFKNHICDLYLVDWWLKRESGPSLHNQDIFLFGRFATHKVFMSFMIRYLRHHDYLSCSELRVVFLPQNNVYIDIHKSTWVLSCWAPQRKSFRQFTTEIQSYVSDTWIVFYVMHESIKAFENRNYNHSKPHKKLCCSIANKKSIWLQDPSSLLNLGAFACSVEICSGLSEPWS